MTDQLTPATYPAECTVTDDQLREVHAVITDDANEDYVCHTEEWPPTDHHGEPYPITFTADELDSRGQLTLGGADYNPFAGNLSPILDGNTCNEPLNRWSRRYPEIRYCAEKTLNEDGVPYCYRHTGRDNMRTAEEVLQTGLHTKTLDHLYEKVGPWKKLVGWGTYESLMGESAYDFGIEYTAKSFDFSEEPIQPDGCDEDGILEAKCGYPTQHLDPSLALFGAAMMGVQMITVQPRIMHEDREAGEGMMESQTIETAQLTAPPSEHDPSPQEFKTLETWSEHHLNLPLSRLVSDRDNLLERGGVNTDPEEDGDTVSDSDIVLEVEADGNNLETSTPTSPNSFDGEKAVSQEIEERVEDG